MAMSEAMRPVVMFSARYLPSLGGVEFFTDNLANQLASVGRHVLVVTTEPSDDADGDVTRMVGDGSVEVQRLNSWGVARAPLVRRDARLREVSARIAGLGGFDALINTRLYDLSCVAAGLCRRLGVRPVLVDHGTGHVTFSNPVLTLASVAVESLNTARLRRIPVDYYGVSRDSSAWLGRLGIASCGEIHNALDAGGFVAQASDRDFLSEWGVGGGALRVAFAGRLLADKGVDAIIDAARRLAGNPRVHFFVAGSGPMEAEVVRADGELGNLSYVGRLDHPDLAALLGQCDVFCLPTRYAEGLPTSLLEAGACGCALVASRAGGVGEIIPDESSGIILANPTGDAIANALVLLAEDRCLLGSLQQAATHRVCERFTWESTAREVLAAFRHASR